LKKNIKISYLRVGTNNTRKQQDIKIWTFINSYINIDGLWKVSIYKFNAMKGVMRAFSKGTQFVANRLKIIQFIELYKTVVKNYNIIHVYY
jgi:hypothetical protein